MPPAEDTPAIVVERYRYILQQINSMNENVYRFLAIFQTLVTAIVTAALVLFVSYSKWKIAPATARTGIQGALILVTVIGVASWLDYRREEVELTARYFAPGFRSQPKIRNFYRWYETYIILFVLAATALLWILGEAFLVPRIK
jgi:hypothetical protein